MMVTIIGADNLLFATEMWGTANVVNPETGRFYDDTLPLVKALSLSADDQRKLLEDNARRLYPRATFG